MGPAEPVGGVEQTDEQVIRLSEDVVKTRVSRGRAMRRLLFARTGATAPEAFRFDRPRCDRVVAGVLKRIGRQAAVAGYSDRTSG